MKKHDIRGKAIDEDIKDRLLGPISPYRDSRNTAEQGYREPQTNLLGL